MGKQIQKTKTKMKIPKIEKVLKLKPSQQMFLERNDKVKQFWLIKSEPEDRFENNINARFSFDDLKQLGIQGSPWDGVRNYQARNYLKSMRIDDECLFYHSNVTKNKLLGPGIIGIAKVITNPHPDDSQFDSQDLHYDPRSSKENPTWWCPDVAYQEKFKKIIFLKDLQDLYAKGQPELQDLFLLKQGRLSVQPVTTKQFEFIKNLSNE